MRLTWLGVFGRWLPVPNGKRLLWGIFNPSAYLAFLLLITVGVEILLQFDNWFLLVYLVLYAAMLVKCYLSFTDLDRVWMASKSRRKTTFLTVIAAVLTVCVIFQTAVIMAYVTYRSESIVLSDVPDSGLDIIQGLSFALLLVCCQLCGTLGWTMLLPIAVGVISFVVVTKVAGTFWASLVVVVLWTLSVYYYARHSLRPNGRLVGPVIR